VSTSVAADRYLLQINTETQRNGARGAAKGRRDKPHSGINFNLFVFRFAEIGTNEKTNKKRQPRFSGIGVVKEQIPL
jgi:hypothetical protein